MTIFIGFLLLLVSCCYAIANFNIYLDEQETMNLFGLPAELYYVRNGIVNKHALDSVVTVSSAVDKLHFMWQNLHTKPITYKLDVIVPEESILTGVKVNISSAGEMPTNAQSFCVEMLCTGIVGGDEIVYININVSVHESDVTELVFKRKKICYRDIEKYGEYVGNDNIAMIEEEDASQLKIFYTVLCIGCSCVTFLIICIFAYFVSNRKEHRHDEIMREQVRLTNSGDCMSAVSCLMVPNIANSGTSTSSNVSHTSIKKKKNYIQLDMNSSDLQDRISEITIQRKRIRLQKIELEGTLGKVYYGKYVKDDGIEEDVIVKTVMDFASPAQISSLLKEGLSMYGLKHQNIMSVFGVCIQDHSQPSIVYLRESYSNLKKFLQKCKLGPEGIARSLTTQEIVEMALQIISAIQYMHKNKLLHKDLAARNCLIDYDLRVKVSDNALSRDLFPNDYHCLGDNENRPIKWLAIESLTERTFSTASDVWSFGVTLWELTTLAQQPYVEVDPFEMEHYLKDGYRLSQPINCPDELFAVMAYCWAMSADERPTFSQLLTCLQDFHCQLNKYV